MFRYRMVVISNIELFKICEFYNISPLKVCMRDELPKKRENGNFIINLEPSSMIGSHWIICTVNHREVMYIDSFGAPPTLETIKFINGPYGYNQFIIQDLKSSDCGFFCVAFLLYMKLNYQKDFYETANNYINMFVDDTRKNDNILKNYFKSVRPICPIIKKKLKI
jgi:hypothetical protein